MARHEPYRSKGPGLRRMVSASCLCVLTFPLAASPVSVSQSLVSQAPATGLEMLLWAVTLDQQPLHEALPVYPVFLEKTGRETYFFPLGELCRALSIGVRVDSAGGTAEGFVVEEKRCFRLELASGSVECGNMRQHFDKEQVRCADGDIYVDMALLEAWLPIRFNATPGESSLLVSPLEKLPIQAQWERQRRVLHPGGNGLGPNGQSVTFPYAIVDIPLVEQTLSLQYGAKRGRGPELAGSSSLHGDLLWMSACANLNYATRARSLNGRFSLYREEPEGTLLGPLHARMVMLGDVMVPPADFLGRSEAILGCAISSYPQAFHSVFDTRDFRGTLPPGWSAELLQNGALTGFQQAGAGGVYEFRDIPVRFGVNQYEVILHGPEGQVRRERSRLDLAQMQPRRGEFFYRLACGKSGGLWGDKRQAGKNTGEQLFGRAEAQYGLSRFLAMDAGLSKEGDDAFLSLGLQGAFPFLSVRACSIAPVGQALGAWMVSLRSGGNRGSVSVSREAFQSNAAMTGMKDRLPLFLGQPLSSRSTIDLNAHWRLGRIGVQSGMGWREERVALGQARQVLFWSLSGNLRRWVFGYGLQKERVAGNRVALPLEGVCRLSFEGESFSVRGEFAYQGRFRHSGGLAQMEWRLSETSALQLTVDRQHNDGTTQSRLSYFNNKGVISLGAQMSHAKSSGLTIGAVIQCSLGREPRKGRWAMNASSFAREGAVSAVAFVDSNGNAIRDADEKMLEGARFHVNGSTSEALSKDSQVGFIGSGGRSNGALVSLDTESIEDPYLKPLVAGYRVNPRPGKVFTLDFPLLPFSEVTGMIRYQGQLRPASGVEIELVGAGMNDGKMMGAVRGEDAVCRTVSAFDGFYDFAQVPPGQYCIRLTPRLQKLGWRLAGEPKLRVSGSGEPCDGIDLLLVREGAEGQAASLALQQDAFPTKKDGGRNDCN